MCVVARSRDLLSANMDINHMESQTPKGDTSIDIHYIYILYIYIFCTHREKGFQTQTLIVTTRERERERACVCRKRGDISLHVD
jgi:hypothetical protein